MQNVIITRAKQALLTYRRAAAKAPAPLIESGPSAQTAGANKTIASRKAVRGKSTVSQSGMDNLQGKKQKKS